RDDLVTGVQTCALPILQELAARMENFCAEHDLNLLVQGGGLPRTKLLEQFKSTPRSVLFGTDSFWSGVDVPGDALRNVIITRLRSEERRVGEEYGCECM